MFADKRGESVKCFTREAHDPNPNDTYYQFYNIQSVIVLWVIILLSFIKLTVIELSVMMLNVVAPS
jgi:surface polysaccharide O-acyltransferase-like enzyme